MSKAPLVSVLIPLYNKVAWVESTIRSALEQTYSNIEVLVIDDGSTDGSADVVEAINDPRMRLIVRENRGANVTRNELLAEARGEFIQYLDADDLLLPHKLEMQVAGLEFDAGVSLCPVWIDSVNGARHPEAPDLGTTETVLWHGIHTAAPLHRKSILNESGGWTEGLIASQEYDFHLRLLAAGHWAKCHLVDEPLAVWRSVPGSTSTNELAVYRGKVDALRRVAESAPGMASNDLARAVANSARNLARLGEFNDATQALSLARHINSESVDEFSKRLRWIKPDALLARAEWIASRLRRLTQKVRREAVSIYRETS